MSVGVLNISEIPASGMVHGVRGLEQKKVLASYLAVPGEYQEKRT